MLPLYYHSSNSFWQVVQLILLRTHDMITGSLAVSLCVTLSCSCFQQWRLRDKDKKCAEPLKYDTSKWFKCRQITEQHWTWLLLSVLGQQIKCNHISSHNKESFNLSLQNSAEVKGWIFMKTRNSLVHNNKLSSHNSWILIKGLTLGVGNLCRSELKYRFSGFKCFLNICSVGVNASSWFSLI